LLDGKPTNTAPSADSAYSRIKTQGITRLFAEFCQATKLQMSYKCPKEAFVTNRLGVLRFRHFWARQVTCRRLPAPVRKEVFWRSGKFDALRNAP
jgi:hypothetical protein